MTESDMKACQPAGLPQTSVTSKLAFWSSGEIRISSARRSCALGIGTSSIHGGGLDGMCGILLLEGLTECRVGWRLMDDKVEHGVGPWRAL
jgi:hypothetical protein